MKGGDWFMKGFMVSLIHGFMVLWFYGFVVAHKTSTRHTGNHETMKPCNNLNHHLATTKRIGIYRQFWPGMFR
jgi:hypothetical protein